MKRVMTAALALALLGGTSALAQPDHRNHRGGEARERQADRREERQERKQDRAEARQERRQERREDRVEVRQERRHDRAEARQDRREDRRDGPRVVHAPRVEQRVIVRDVDRRVSSDRQRRERIEQAQRYERRAAQTFRRPGDGYRLRDRDRNRSWYDSSRYRHAYYSQQRYRAPAYRYPTGYYVRSWSFGDFLPRGWYSQPYYLDWWSYGLPRPPIGTEWIRNRDDAILVDVWTGRVLAVYYDLFW